MQHYSAVLQQRLLAVMQLYDPADFKDLGSCCILVLTADNCCWNSVIVNFIFEIVQQIYESVRIRIKFI